MRLPPFSSPPLYYPQFRRLSPVTSWSSDRRFIVGYGGPFFSLFFALVPFYLMQRTFFSSALVSAAACVGTPLGALPDGTHLALNSVVSPEVCSRSPSNLRRCQQTCVPFPLAILGALPEKSPRNDHLPNLGSLPSLPGCTFLRKKVHDSREVNIFCLLEGRLGLQILSPLFRGESER